MGHPYHLSNRVGSVGMEASPMTAEGKLAIAEHALREIIKAHDSNSFVALDKAIDNAKVVYDDLMRWVRRPADVVPLRARG